MRKLFSLLLILSPGTLLLSSCGEESGSVPEVPSEELAAEVPELDAVHEFMQPIWHEAFPAQDVEAIAAAVPAFDTALAALDTAELPGILQDKQTQWDAQKTLLMETFVGLEDAVKGGDSAQILAYTEALHMNYEGMVRIVRPLVPELDAFHQLLYGVYHYYGPGYDVERIRNAASEMVSVMPTLRTAQLPSRLEEHQAEFDTGVGHLGEAVAELQATLEDPDRTSVEAAIENVHSAYEAVEGIFDSGSHG